MALLSNTGILPDYQGGMIQLPVNQTQATPVEGEGKPKENKKPVTPKGRKEHIQAMRKAGKPIPKGVRAIDSQIRGIPTVGDLENLVQEQKLSTVDPVLAEMDTINYPDIAFGAYADFGTFIGNTAHMAKDANGMNVTEVGEAEDGTYIFDSTRNRDKAAYDMVRLLRMKNDPNLRKLWEQNSGQTLGPNAFDNVSEAELAKINNARISKEDFIDAMKRRDEFHAKSFDKFTTSGIEGHDSGHEQNQALDRMKDRGLKDVGGTYVIPEDASLGDKLMGFGYTKPNSDNALVAPTVASDDAEIIQGTVQGLASVAGGALARGLPLAGRMATEAVAGSAPMIPSAMSASQDRADRATTNLAVGAAALPVTEAVAHTAPGVIRSIMQKANNYLDNYPVGSYIPEKHLVDQTARTPHLPADPTPVAQSEVVPPKVATESAESLSAGAVPVARNLPREAVGAAPSAPKPPKLSRTERRRRAKALAQIPEAPQLDASKMDDAGVSKLQDTIKHNPEELAKEILSPELGAGRVLGQTHEENMGESLHEVLSQKGEDKTMSLNGVALVATAVTASAGLAQAGAFGQEAQENIDRLLERLGQVATVGNIATAGLLFLVASRAAKGHMSSGGAVSEFINKIASRDDAWGSVASKYLNISGAVGRSIDNTISDATTAVKRISRIHGKDTALKYAEHIDQVRSAENTVMAEINAMINQSGLVMQPHQQPYLRKIDEALRNRQELKWQTELLDGIKQKLAKPLQEGETLESRNEKVLQWARQKHSDTLSEVEAKARKLNGTNSGAKLTSYHGGSRAKPSVFKSLESIQKDVNKKIAIINTNKARIVRELVAHGQAEPIGGVHYRTPEDVDTLLGLWESIPNKVARALKIEGESEGFMPMHTMSKDEYSKLYAQDVGLFSADPNKAGFRKYVPTVAKLNTTLKNLISGPDSVYHQGLDISTMSDLKSKGKVHVISEGRNHMGIQLVADATTGVLDAPTFAPTVISMVRHFTKKYQAHHANSAIDIVKSAAHRVLKDPTLAGAMDIGNRKVTRSIQVDLGQVATPPKMVTFKGENPTGLIRIPEEMISPLLQRSKSEILDNAFMDAVAKVYGNIKQGMTRYTPLFFIKTVLPMALKASMMEHGSPLALVANIFKEAVGGRGRGMQFLGGAFGLHDSFIMEMKATGLHTGAWSDSLNSSKGVMAMMEDRQYALDAGSQLKNIVRAVTNPLQTFATSNESVEALVTMAIFRTFKEQMLKEARKKGGEITPEIYAKYITKAKVSTRAVFNNNLRSGNNLGRVLNAILPFYKAMTADLHNTVGNTAKAYLAAQSAISAYQMAVMSLDPDRYFAVPYRDRASGIVIPTQNGYTRMMLPQYLAVGNIFPATMLEFAFAIQHKRATGKDFSAFVAYDQDVSDALIACTPFGFGGILGDLLRQTTDVVKGSDIHKDLVRKGATTYEVGLAAEIASYDWAPFLANPQLYRLLQTAMGVNGDNRMFLDMIYAKARGDIIASNGYNPRSGAEGDLASNLASTAMTSDYGIAHNTPARLEAEARRAIKDAEALGGNVKKSFNEILMQAKIPASERGKLISTYVHHGLEGITPENLQTIGNGLQAVALGFKTDKDFKPILDEEGKPIKRIKRGAFSENNLRLYYNDLTGQ